MQQFILLRIFAEEPSEELARRNVASRVGELTKKYANIFDVKIEKYWKIPQYFEIAIRFSPLDEVDSVFNKIISILGTGWQMQQPSESIWNYSSYGSDFALNSVRWAHIEVLGTGSPPVVSQPGRVR